MRARDIVRAVKRARRNALARAGKGPRPRYSRSRASGVACALRLCRERPGVPYREALTDELMADL